MEEPTYEYDWRCPITVPNPNNKSGVSKEKGSFKWFKYWLENDCSYVQVAKKFKKSPQGIHNIAKLFKWEERKANKEDYESRKREELTEKRYVKFLEEEYNRKISELETQNKLLEKSIKMLDIAEDEYDISAIKTISKIIQNHPRVTSGISSDLYRAFGKPATINDNQNHKITAEVEVSTRLKKIFDKDRLDERYNK